MSRPAATLHASGEPEHAPGPVGEDTAFPLRLHALHKRWRPDLPPVLDGLDLVLEPGEATWVGGRNGAGKTTMLRIAAGLIEPDSGRAEVWGLAQRVARARYQRLVSFLPAGDRGLYARLTVRQQLDFCARVGMLDSSAVDAVVERAVERFELRELEQRRVDRMSMGQRQRVRVAMTFMVEPEIVLLDEPLTSLDEEGALLLLEAVRELLARDGCVLWCSPGDESLAPDFESRWTLEHGRLAPT
jgi:ABC-2 type transport system ATP-binding protein